MKIFVNKNDTLLNYLENNFNIPRKNIKKYLKNGCIFVDGTKTTKFDYPLNIKSIIYIDTHSNKYNNLPFDIIYEDENIIVVDKPSGMLSIATTKEKEITVYHILREYLKSKNSKFKLFIIHRLDKDTSGILMFAKSEYVKNKFQNDWDNLVKLRSYIAIVHGVPKKKQQTLVNYLKETKTRLVYISKPNEGKKAITSYKIVKENSKYSKLEINIQTGRKNQIRVQLAHINHPIVGDRKYGSDNEKRLLLHANRLDIYNPISKKNMTFTSKVPNIFNSKFK